jgi:CDP-4-dehydro-6-deoxyglucose reductase, E3
MTVPAPGSIVTASSASGTSGPLTAALVRKDEIAPGIVELEFAMRSPERLQFRGGQFVSMTVDAPGSATPAPPTADGAPVATPKRRSYSIASPSSAGDRLRFIIRVIPEGTASEFLMSLPVGGEVRMTGPHGFFVLDVAHPGDVVFGATGTGISAVMPMLPELGAMPVTGRRVVYWGVRQAEDLFARDEIERLCREAGCELKLFLTSPPPAWTGFTGRITAGVVLDLPNLVAPTFYLVGNGAMIAELKRELVERGVNRKKQIRTEAFFD